MMNDKDKIQEIKRREAAIRAVKWKRQLAVYGCSSAAACLLLIVAVADLFNGMTKEGVAGSAIKTEFGSVFAMSRMGAMVLLIVAAFALGVCVTMLLTKIHDRNERRKKL